MNCLILQLLSRHTLVTNCASKNEENIGIIFSCGSSIVKSYSNQCTK